jgi:hypothetical protein
VVGSATAVPDARNQGRQLTVHELVDALASYVENTTEQADQQRAVEREAQEAADDQARQEIRQMRALHPGVGVPDGG